MPGAFLGPVAGALDGLLARFARTHGPFLGSEPARRWGLPAGVVDDALHRLVAAGSLLAGEFRPGGAEREYCDPEVLRLLRRRSLAKLRREVEPVDPGDAGAVPARVAGRRRRRRPRRGVPASPFRGPAALERLAEVVDQLAGLPIPASVLERDVLPARIPGYQPRLLDELGAMGEVAWVGRGSLGRDDGRVVLYRPGPRAAAARRGRRTAWSGRRRELHERLRAHLAPAGRLLLPGAVHGPSAAGSDREVLDALWDLVWAGEVTNDTFAPLRALRWKRPGEGSPAATRPADGARTAGGRGPLVAGGRRVEAGGDAAGDGARRRAAPGPTRTERVHAQALVLLERHGVLTREAVAGEPVDGGFSAVYPVLRAMEEAGRIRRGLLRGRAGRRAVRAARAPWTGSGRCGTSPASWRASTDGSSTSWRPRIPRTRTGPRCRGRAATTTTGDRSSARPARTWCSWTGPRCCTWTAAGRRSRCSPPRTTRTRWRRRSARCADLVADGRARELVIGKVDGEPVAGSPHREALLAAGFVQGYRGYALEARVSGRSYTGHMSEKKRATRSVPRGGAAARRRLRSW